MPASNTPLWARYTPTSGGSGEDAMFDSTAGSLAAMQGGSWSGDNAPVALGRINAQGYNGTLFKGADGYYLDGKKLPIDDATAHAWLTGTAQAAKQEQESTNFGKKFDSAMSALGPGIALLPLGIAGATGALGADIASGAIGGFPGSGAGAGVWEAGMSGGAPAGATGGAGSLAGTAYADAASTGAEFADVAMELAPGVTQTVTGAGADTLANAGLESTLSNTAGNVQPWQEPTIPANGGEPIPSGQPLPDIPPLNTSVPTPNLSDVVNTAGTAATTAVKTTGAGSIWDELATKLGLPAGTVGAAAGLKDIIGGLVGAAGSKDVADTYAKTMGNATSQYTDIMNKAIAAADPFASQRGQYQGQLAGMLNGTNNSSNNPNILPTTQQNNPNMLSTDPSNPYMMRMDSAAPSGQPMMGGQPNPTSPQFNNPSAIGASGRAFGYGGVPSGPSYGNDSFVNGQPSLPQMGGMANPAYNEYGDPEGTMYMGGSPTFDERTGTVKPYTGQNGMVTGGSPVGASKTEFGVTSTWDGQSWQPQPVQTRDGPNGREVFSGGQWFPDQQMSAMGGQQSPQQGQSLNATISGGNPNMMDITGNNPFMMNNSPTNNPAMMNMGPNNPYAMNMNPNNPYMMNNSARNNPNLMNMGTDNPYMMGTGMNDPHMMSTSTENNPWLANTDINGFLKSPLMQNLSDVTLDNTARRLTSKYGGDVGSLGVQNEIAKQINAANAPLALDYYKSNLQNNQQYLNTASSNNNSYLNAATGNNQKYLGTAAGFNQNYINTAATNNQTYLNTASGNNQKYLGTAADYNSKYLNTATNNNQTYLNTASNNNQKYLGTAATNNQAYLNTATNNNQNYLRTATNANDAYLGRVSTAAGANIQPNAGSVGMQGASGLANLYGNMANTASTNTNQMYGNAGVAANGLLNLLYQGKPNG